LNIRAADGAKKKKKKRAHLRDARLAHKLGATAATAAAAAHWLAKLCVHWGRSAGRKQQVGKCRRDAFERRKASRCGSGPTATEFVSYMRRVLQDGGPQLLI
jgi:hypothetical protein